MGILIVDDEQDVQFLFQQQFRREIRKGELQLHFVLSGEEAIHFLESHQAEIVLILSDINMPGMNGFELLEYIKTRDRSIQVIMVTAYGDSHNYQRAMQIGADGFVTKPIDFHQLRETILAHYRKKN